MVGGKGRVLGEEKSPSHLNSPGEGEMEAGEKCTLGTTVRE
jgi:hypothetical protein